MASMHVDDLLSQEGEQFLSVAYAALLKRSCDPQGLRHYMRRLAIGRPKIEILYELARSKEGARGAKSVKGLTARAKRYRRSRIPFVGRLLIKVAPEDSAAALDCQFRRMEFLVAHRAIQSSGSGGSANLPTAPSRLSLRERLIHDRLARRIIAVPKVGF
jgi:hypothetical protein